MKKTVVFVLIALLSVLCGCSAQPMGSQSGIGVVFDGQPHIFDPSVICLGNPVGQVLSSEWSNGVTRVTISLDGPAADLKKTNMAVVVKNGHLQLNTLGTHGVALAPSQCINGFVNTASYRWFKFKHLINNITISADRRAQQLLARSGLAG